MVMTTELIFVDPGMQVNVCSDRGDSASHATATGDKVLSFSFSPSPFTF